MSRCAAGGSESLRIKLLGTAQPFWVHSTSFFRCRPPESDAAVGKFGSQNVPVYKLEVWIVCGRLCDFIPLFFKKTKFTQIHEQSHVHFNLLPCTLEEVSSYKWRSVSGLRSPMTGRHILDMSVIGHFEWKNKKSSKKTNTKERKSLPLTA